MRDALKNYLSLASGFTEIGRRRAVAASKALAAQGEATAEQVQGLAEELLETSRTNREHVTNLVRNEVEKTLTRLGIATADDLAALTRRLEAVEAAVRKPVAKKPAAKAPAKKPVAKKPAAKKPAR